MSANKLLLFASLREIAGTSAVEIEAGTLGELVAEACDRFGSSFAQICERSIAAVDGENVPSSEWDSFSLDGSIEIALLPPVSGGAPATAAVLTVNDRCSAWEAEDTSGPAIVEFLESEGYEVAATDIVADDATLIGEKISQWADFLVARLIVTTGGTGLGPRDVTPEATRDVLDKEAPGIGELMRASADTSLAYLSRQTAGVRNGCLVINLPGSRAAAVECLVAVAEVLEHALHAAGGGGHEAAGR